MNLKLDPVERELNREREKKTLVVLTNSTLNNNIYLSFKIAVAAIYRSCLKKKEFNTFVEEID